MKYVVRISRRAQKNAEKMPRAARMVLARLLEDLEAKGPVLPGYSHYSKIGDNRYHCHLLYRWVACWYSEDDSFKVEVYYAGSRESAPY